VNVPTGPALEVTLVAQRSTLQLLIRERKGRVLGVSSPPPAWRFQHRARLYGVLDSRLHSKTRFFGAACATNRVFGQLASLGGAIAHASVCSHWLSELGTSLEIVNRSIADAVHTGRLGGPGLDERIVSIEQSVVERSLQWAKASRAGAECDVLPTLDALLNHRGWISTLLFSPAVQWYRRVLAEVRHELKSPIEFARQLHREKIGIALIGALQREEASSAHRI
jgi:hypothetical protein